MIKDQWIKELVFDFENDHFKCDEDFENLLSKLNDDQKQNLKSQLTEKLLKKQKKLQEESDFSEFLFKNDSKVVEVYENENKELTIKTFEVSSL